MPYGAEQLGELVVGSRSTPSGVLGEQLGAISRWAVAGVDVIGVRGGGPSGVRSHTAYSTTRARARTAASTAG